MRTSGSNSCGHGQRSPASLYPRTSQTRDKGRTEQGSPNSSTFSFEGAVLFSPLSRQACAECDSGLSGSSFEMCLRCWELNPEPPACPASVSPRGSTTTLKRVSPIRPGICRGPQTSNHLRDFLSVTLPWGRAQLLMYLSFPTTNPNQIRTEPTRKRPSSLSLSQPASGLLLWMPSNQASILPLPAHSFPRPALFGSSLNPCHGYRQNNTTASVAEPF